MSVNTAALASDWHRVGAGLSVRFEYRGERLNAEWQPRLPTKREWKRVLDRYRAARQQFLHRLAESAGPVVCVEVDF